MTRKTPILEFIGVYTLHSNLRLHKGIMTHHINNHITKIIKIYKFYLAILEVTIKRAWYATKLNTQKYIHVCAAIGILNYMDFIMTTQITYELEP
jgi:hypothetical protein